MKDKQNLRINVTDYKYKRFLDGERTPQRFRRTRYITQKEYDELPSLLVQPQSLVDRVYKKPRKYLKKENVWILTKKEDISKIQSIIDANEKGF